MVASASMATLANVDIHIYIVEFYEAVLQGWLSS